MQDDGVNQFNYVYSCELDANVQIKIGSLEGRFEKPHSDALLADPSLAQCVTLLHGSQSVPTKDLFVTCSVYSSGRMIGSHVTTSYRCPRGRWNWNEWLTMPVKFAELSRDAQLAISIFDIHDSIRPHCIGGTTISLFSKRGVFRSGILDLRVWPFREADGRVPTSTPGKLSGKTRRVVDASSVDDDEQPEKWSEMRRLSKLVKEHRAGLIARVDWLDRVAFRQIETVNRSDKLEQRSLFIMIEFPRVQQLSTQHHTNRDYAIVYYEKDGDRLLAHRTRPALVTCPDAEIGADNLVEAKHHLLTRSARSGAIDRALKPNAAARDALERAVQAPASCPLTGEQRDLIWKFRYSLASQKKALTKFVRAVNWDEAHEARQAIDLLREWAPIESEDALELLSAGFTHPVVRRYAVSRLMFAAAEDKQLYLLQLVQALKYEHFGSILSGSDASFVQDITSNAPVMVTEANVDDIDDDEEDGDGDDDESMELPDLASFLINCACKDAVFANYLYWYLKVEVDCHQSRTTATLSIRDRTKTAAMYATVLRRLRRALSRGGIEAKRRAALLNRQQLFVNRFVDVMKAVSKESGNRKRKTEFLQTQLSQPNADIDLLHLDGLPLPVDPCVRVTSILPERASIFSSNLMPIKLTFRTTDNQHYITMFKRGDDLRQDQLVIQMIRLMDKILRADKLDLRLTPYHVLATSVEDGFVQFIESVPLRDVISTWGNIQEMFRFYRPSTTGPYGIESDVIDNYVRSCAGYSVICYLLGIGDRHQHNLLLCQNGRLFHVDFGFILGRDPKPLPPPMKLTTDMIEGMGGASSRHWQEFRRLCYTAFLLLRRHTNVILNLFSLMLDAGIPDIALEPDKAVNKIQERFHLNLNDEEAVQMMQTLIDQSTSAKMPVIVDFMHDMRFMMS